LGLKGHDGKLWTMNQQIACRNTEFKPMSAVFFSGRGEKHGLAFQI